jgi:hypothetical protein
LAAELAAAGHDPAPRGDGVDEKAGQTFDEPS